jgi:hypothetical protein
MIISAAGTSDKPDPSQTRTTPLPLPAQTNPSAAPNNPFGP